MEHQPLPFADFVRLLMDVTTPPEIVNHHEFVAAVHANTPASLQGTERDVVVVVSLSISAGGAILGLCALPPDPEADASMNAILHDEDGQGVGTVAEATADPEILAAAERAAAVLRFAPAEKDGRHVPFPDLRVGVAFSGRMGPAS